MICLKDLSNKSDGRKLNIFIRMLPSLRTRMNKSSHNFTKFFIEEFLILLKISDYSDFEKDY